MLWLDHSVYPDYNTSELPTQLHTPQAKADYLARICGAWDFGIIPTPETFDLFRHWQSIFDTFPLASSPSYSAFRAWFGWPPLPSNHQILCANYERLDKRGMQDDVWIAQPWSVSVNFMSLQPTPPSTLDPVAVAILQRLQAFPEASAIVLGGHFALKHYLDYRETHDIDAWWDISTSPSGQKAALEKIKEVMQAFAVESDVEFYERSSALVYSAELQRNRKTFFSFQIADRECQLQEPLDVPWTPIKIEQLVDNVGEKMNALVNRGAPRDFVDIRAVVVSNIFTVDEVWSLWEQKNPRLNTQAAKQEVLRHLQSIELRRPVESLPANQREQSVQNRQWFREYFLKLPPQQLRGLKP